MAHYAFLNELNVVTEVITGKDETELLDGLTPEEWYGNFRKQRCIRTSYNGNIRKQFAGIGFTYSDEGDVFILPQPYASWSLDSNYDWTAPVPMPSDDKPYTWNEDSGEWEEIIIRG